MQPGEPMAQRTAEAALPTAMVNLWFPVVVVKSSTLADHVLTMDLSVDANRPLKHPNRTTLTGKCGGAHKDSNLGPAD